MTTSAEARLQDRIMRFVPTTVPSSAMVDWFFEDYARLEGENTALREQLDALTSRITMTIPGGQ